METQKYYDFENGLYCVYFPNRKGLSIEEITKIFAEFGNVVAVNKAGDDFGYRFVKYRLEEEAIRCIEGLRHHPSVTLKMKDPNHKKNKNQANNRLSNLQFGQKNFENNGQKTTNRVESKSQFSNNNSPAAESKTYSTPDAKHKKLQDIRVANFEAPKQVTSLRQPKALATVFNSPHTETTSKDVGKSSDKSSNNSQKSSKSKGLPKKPIVAAKSSGAVPHNQPHVAAQEIPRLVGSNSSSSSTTQNDRETRNPEVVPPAVPMTVTAEEVVVANIHSDFGVHYILHLVQKHDPLCVSQMKIVSSLGLRYCIIYLQSMHQAYAIEKEFDNYELSGKELMVLRSQRLAELAI